MPFDLLVGRGRLWWWGVCGAGPVCRCGPKQTVRPAAPKGSPVSPNGGPCLAGAHSVHVQSFPDCETRRAPCTARRLRSSSGRARPRAPHLRRSAAVARSRSEHRRESAPWHTTTNDPVARLFAAKHSPCEGRADARGQGIASWHGRTNRQQHGRAAGCGQAGA